MKLRKVPGTRVEKRAVPGVHYKDGETGKIRFEQHPEGSRATRRSAVKLRRQINRDRMRRGLSRYPGS